MREFYDLHVHLSELNYKKAESALDVISYIGVTRAALQSLTYRSAAYNLWLLHVKNTYKRMDLSVFGMPHFEGPYTDIPLDVQARALIELGCDGIKLMNAPGSRRRLGFGPNDPRYDKMLDYLEENSIPVLMHVADPEEFWDESKAIPYWIERGWVYFEEGYLTKEEIYEEVLEMLDKHPNLRITFAHFFSLSNFIDRAAEIMDKYPNVTFDLAPGWEMFLGFNNNYEKAREFFIKYKDRIIYGTDTNNSKRSNAEIHMLVRMALERSDEFMMPYYSEKIIRGLHLPEDVLDAVYRDNYTRFVGTPKAVNTSLLESYAHRMLEDIAESDDPICTSSTPWLNEILTK